MKTKPHRIGTGTAKSSPESNLREQIEKRAYEIWMVGGGRHGEDITHWLQAESEVREEQRQARRRQPPARA